MKPILPLMTLCLTVTSSALAQSLTISNSDGETHKLEVIFKDSDSGKRHYLLEDKKSIKKLCDRPCIIRLETGIEHEFLGDELVIIVDGDFVIAD